MEEKDLKVALEKLVAIGDLAEEVRKTLAKEEVVEEKEAVTDDLGRLITGGVS